MSHVHAVAGHHREVVCVDPPASQNINLSDSSDQNLSINRVGPGHLGWAYTSYLDTWLANQVHGYDAVVVNGIWLYPSFAVWKALRPRSGKRSSIPYFVFPHGMLDPWFQHAPGRRLKAIRNWVYWKLIEQRVVRDAAGVFFTCEQERLLARGTFSPYQAKEYVLNYGTTASPPFSPEMRSAFAKICPEVGDRPYLLFLGRLHPKKGVEDLIRAYAQVSLNKEVPLLVVAGPGGDTPYGVHIQKLAKHLSADMNQKNQTHRAEILFPGMVSGAAKWGAFYGCDAFVLPSHQENFGIAVAEALSCSRPVLISKEVNIWPEIVQAGAGIAAEDSFAGTVQLLDQWSNMAAECRRAFQKSALECFQSRFTIDRAAQQMVDAIQCELSNR